MSMTPIYIGIGVGAAAAIAYALYKYYTREIETDGSNVETNDINNDAYEKVEVLEYTTLLYWLKSKYKSGDAKSGDSFVILQNAVAAPSFTEIFPDESKLINSCKCISVSIVRDDMVKVAKFFICDVIGETLTDILPEDEETAYVINLTDDN